MRETEPPSIIVFGFDPEGKPCAARFAERDAELATKAAHLLGYRLARIPEARLGRNLPQGNVFATGTGLVRRVTRRAFAELVAAVDQAAAPINRPR